MRVAIVALVAGLGYGSAAAACGLPAWSATVPPVNQEHIFCGEIAAGGAVKGYHSATVVPPGAGQTVTGIAGIAPRPTPGLYDARATFRNGATKFSTFFPNGCSQAQIVTSVLYAYSHNGGPVAPWGISGMSAPPTGGAIYCLDATGQPFEIRMGTLGAGGGLRINTAFPR